MNVYSIISLLLSVGSFVCDIISSEKEEAETKAYIDAVVEKKIAQLPKSTKPVQKAKK